MHAMIRDKVFSGELQAAIVRYQGEIAYPLLEELKAGWPEAGDGTTAYRLADLWPILLVEADLDREFPDGTGNEIKSSETPTTNGKKESYPSAKELRGMAEEYVIECKKLGRIPTEVGKTVLPEGQE